MRFTQIISLILFTVTLSVAQAQPEHVKFPPLNADGLKTLQMMTMQLEQLCPQPDCGMLFLGRSNFLLSAYLEAKGNGQVVNLPASSIGSFIGPSAARDEARDKFKEMVLSDKLGPRLKQWKKVVVVDFVFEGGSLSNGAAWIKEFIRENKASTEVEVAAYGAKLSEKRIMNQFDARHILYHRIETGDVKRVGSPQFLAFNSMLEDHSPYDQWIPYQGKEIIYDSEKRRPYLSGKSANGYFTHYASYDDLVESFRATLDEKKDWVRYTSGPSFCSTMLHQFLGNIFK